MSGGEILVHVAEYKVGGAGEKVPRKVAADIALGDEGQTGKQIEQERFRRVPGKSARISV